VRRAELAGRASDVSLRKGDVRLLSSTRRVTNLEEVVARRGPCWVPSDRVRKFALKYSVRIRRGAARATPGDPEPVKNRTPLLVGVGNAEGGSE